MRQRVVISREYLPSRPLNVFTFLAVLFLILRVEFGLTDFWAGAFISFSVLMVIGMFTTRERQVRPPVRTWPEEGSREP